jgi:hypothetical protein
MSKSSLISKNLIDVVTKINNNFNYEIDDNSFLNQKRKTQELALSQLIDRPYLKKSYYNFVENFDFDIEI